MQQIGDMLNFANSSFFWKIFQRSGRMLANNVSKEVLGKRGMRRKRVGHSGTRMIQYYAKVLDPSIKRDMDNLKDCFDWFKQKQKRFLNSIGINPKEKREMKI